MNYAFCFFITNNTIMRHLLLLLLTITIAANAAQAQFVEKSTSVLCLVPSATAAVNTIARHDRKGLLQLALSSATCIAINYGLEAAITKERPDGTGKHAFPSTHTAAAFNGATFLTIRYGWKWGVPAYALATYVGWGRIYSDRHDIWDVLGGAALGAGTALIFTRPFKTQNAEISISPTFGSGKYGISAAMRF
jgi:membrane-associated phospholipid phosphatase